MMEGGDGSAMNSRMTKTEQESMTSIKNCRTNFDTFLEIVQFTGLPNEHIFIMVKAKLGWLETSTNIIKSYINFYFYN
jgi:hypothetical protein